MAYLTRGQAVAAARRAVSTVDLAESELRKSAQAPLTRRFDLFLSHSIGDAEVILGVKELLETEGLSVYVDWVVDPQLDRRKVTPATAARLRERMNRCGYLLYASSSSSSNSKWMPWELGYFDGRRGRVGILPVVASAGAGFAGVEYLGLYPRVELAEVGGGRRRFGIYSSDRTGVRTLGTLART
jgi:hypothetical protein